MEKIRILIVAGAMDVGGIENQLMHLLRNADKHKFQIDFTTTMDHPFYQDEIEMLGGRCIRIPATEGRHFFRQCRRLYQIMKDGRYDIVHSHELFHSGMVLLTAKLAGVRHRSVHAHNWSDDDGDGRRSAVRSLYNAVMRRWILRYGTDFCACSSLAGRFLYGEKKTKDENYHLIFNSVDTAKFLGNYDKKESGAFCDDGWLNVIQVGRFSPVKNQLFTAEIAQELKKRGRKIRILCVGNNGSEYEQLVRQAVSEKGISEEMLLLGVRKDIDVLLRKASAFLLPSLYEGMPLVMIEAQSAGLPCITADTYSHEVDFGIGYVQWLSLKQSAAEWADAVEKAVAAPRADKTAVERAIQKNGFDSRVFAERLCRLYENAMKRK